MTLRKRFHVMTVVTLLTLAGWLLGASVALAQQKADRPSTGAGVDFPTAYYFRGILQENSGIIAQPYVSGTLSLYEGGEGFNSFSASLGIWNSFHGQQTLNDGDPKSWYEADLYGGIAAGFLNVFEFSTTYTAYTSPNGAFNDVHEIAFTLSFDDSALLGDFALSPYVAVAFELDGHATGSNEGVYMEIGVEPGYTFQPDSKYPITLSFPLKLGLSLHDYYEDPNTGSDETFGYFDGGIALNIPLAFMPAKFGEWGFSASGHFLALGDSTEALNNGDSFVALGIFGFSLTY